MKPGVLAASVSDGASAGTFAHCAQVPPLHPNAAQGLGPRATRGAPSSIPRVQAGRRRAGRGRRAHSRRHSSRPGGSAPDPPSGGGLCSRHLCPATSRAAPLYICGHRGRHRLLGPAAVPTATTASAMRRGRRQRDPAHCHCCSPSLCDLRVLLPPPANPPPSPHHHPCPRTQLRGRVPWVRRDSSGSSASADHRSKPGGAARPSERGRGAILDLRDDPRAKPGKRNPTRRAVDQLRPGANGPAHEAARATRPQQPNLENGSKSCVFWG